MRSASVSRVIAALFTRISSLPNFASACWKPFFTCAASATSIGTASASPPAAAISAASAASFSVLRAASSNLGARLGQRQRSGAADSLRRAGNESDFIFEREHDWDSTCPATSARACAILSSDARKLAASSTLKQRTERSIWRSSPERTLPGPTSTKMFDALIDHLAHGLEPAHRQLSPGESAPRALRRPTRSPPRPHW